MTDRQYSILDQLLNEVNRGLSSVFATSPQQRANPADDIDEQPLSPQQQRQSAGMMRVNHTGEVCAQALYYGQLIVARNPQTRTMLEQAATEETDHLAWTQQRLIELNSHTSKLNLYWYTHSLLTGMLAGLAGDGFSLGFVEETEQQVSRHLDQHLDRLAPNDEKSRCIIQQMRIDEQQHAETAADAGARKLPNPIKKLMALQAKVMTTLAYWI